MDLNAAVVREALALLGAILSDRRQDAEIIVIGGAALLLHEWIDRPTVDLDVAALGPPDRPRTARPLPAELQRAVDDVAAALSLPSHWLNSGPTDPLDFGLPEGFAERVSTRTYGHLVVHLAGRLDLICTKLYAAVDRGPRSRHTADLRALNPSSDELRFAARWTQTHDPSQTFAQELAQALQFFGVEDGHEDG